jgi:hypothetical protein
MDHRASDFMNGVPQRTAVPLAGFRTLARGAAGAIAWVGVATFAVVVFSQRTVPQPTGHLVNTEIVGFASAFLVGGAVSGVAAMLVYGGPRRALAMAVLLTLLAALVIFATRQTLAVKTVPASAWFENEWARTRSGLRTGTALGVPFGLVVALIVTGIGVLTGRRMTWRLGLAVAILLSVVAIWALPSWALGGISELAILQRWDELGFGDISTIRGAGAGAMSGALLGAVVAALGARCCPGRGQTVSTGALSDLSPSSGA